MGKIIAFAVWVLITSTIVSGDDLVLFDFETESSINDWTGFKSDDLKADFPAPKAEWSTESASAGTHSLKLTFSAGKFAGLSTDKLNGDWKPPLVSFHADVTAARDCLVLFRAIPKVTKERPDPKSEGPLYIKAARLKAGKNHVQDLLFPNNFGGYGSLGAKHGPVVQFDIVLYDAREGDVLFVDNVRLSPDPLKAATSFSEKTVFNLGEQPKDYPPFNMPPKIRVLGSDQEFSTVMELAEAHKDKWTEPTERTIDQVEADIRAEYEKLKAEHPKALLAILRDGVKGFDPANPDKAFDSWSDAYLGAQAPTSLSYRSIGRGNGKDATIEFAFRHRCPIFRVNVSSIPAGATILKAQLALTRIVSPDRKQLEGNYRSNSPFKPTFWVAEACNRDWVEAQTNGFEYATGKFWNEANGMDWSSDDPDFRPLIIAHGQAGLTVSTWDFTWAVSAWTSGKLPNHGFCFYPVRGYLDFGRFWSREQKDPKRRPAMYVVYEMQ